MHKFKIITIAFIFCSGLVISVVWLNKTFQSAERRDFFTGCRKIWSHSSSSEDFTLNEQNYNDSYARIIFTIDRFKRAYSNGARGIELDIMFLRSGDPSGEDFYVEHDAPHPGESVLLAAEVFDWAPADVYLWLDFKNLNEMSGQKLELVADRLDRMLKAKNLKERVIVESNSARALSPLVKRGIHTSYWVHPQYQPYFPLTFYFVANKYKLDDIIYGPFSVFSFRYHIYDPEIISYFKGISFHLFTVNDVVTMEKIGYNPAVRVILSDKNYYQKDFCR